MNIYLEYEMAIHCSILAWKIPWTEESGKLQSMGLQRDMTEQLSMQHAYISPFIYHIPKILLWHFIGH